MVSGKGKVASVVIPARLNSSRLPRKVLADLGDQPVLKHVWDRAHRLECAGEVIVATDSEEVYETAKAWGADVVMTPESCASGTERIIAILSKLKHDIVLNIQGDEPFVNVEMLDALISQAHDSKADVVTPVSPIESLDELKDPNLVKAALNANHFVLYFSRSPIPYLRDIPEAEWMKHQAFHGHIGVYAYCKKALKNYSALKAGKLERLEKLEQLRFLENGYHILAMQTTHKAIGIDTADDLEAARKQLRDPE